MNQGGKNIGNWDWNIIVHNNKVHDCVPSGLHEIYACLLKTKHCYCCNIFVNTCSIGLMSNYVDSIAFFLT